MPFLPMNEKICPRCKTPHIKPGVFCSRSCANARQWTDEHKKIFSERQRQYMAQDNEQVELHKWKLVGVAQYAGAVRLDKFNEEEDSKEDFFMLPELNDEEDLTEFIQDGAIWSVDRNYE